MKSVSESEASEDIKQLYRRISRSLQVPSAPLFFKYLAKFPAYFTSVVPQIINNFEDQKFIDLTTSVGTELTQRMKQYVPKDIEVADWIEKYQHSPSLYNMRISLQQIHEVNTKLAFVFLGLREAVKGWAVAAPKLGSNVSSSPDNSHVELEHDEEQFVYSAMDEQLAHFSKFYISNEAVVDQNKKRSDRALAQSDPHAIEKNLYISYLDLCQKYFSLETKKDNYVYFRVQSEKAVLMGIELMPHTILSPINVVIDLVPEQKEFLDLCCMLSENFPILSVQRLLFSGYMIF